MGVYLGRADRCVTEELLDAHEVGAALEQVRREAVAQRVRRAVGDPGAAERRVERAADVGRPERAPADGEEDRAGAARAGEPRAAVLEVARERGGGRIADRHLALAVALPDHA